MGQHHHVSGRSLCGRRRLVTTLSVAALLAAGAAITGAAVAQTTPEQLPFDIQSLDGSGNNVANPTWGQVGNEYSRVASARYADGVGEMVAGPNPRYISNRIFNDTHQNLFSEHSVTQWGFAWGQFLDHTFGQRAAATAEPAAIPFDAADPIEEFENDLGVIGFERSAVSPGSGVDSPREQINTVNSYISGWPVYGGTAQRLEWLRDGSVDGDISDNEATLFLPDSYLPRADSRGNPANAPAMDAQGNLAAEPERAAVAGDTRANENIALTATHTLFAREHNRIVSLLPDSLTEEEKFQIARRVVIAEQQYITYNEFLPAMGVVLPAYTGYDPDINTDLSNEFATVGYRAHSMIHGDIEVATTLDRYSVADQIALEDQGLELAVDGDAVGISIPLNRAFFNPDLLELVQLGPVLQGLGLEAQYRNDEQIDNQLRSVLFQVPVDDNPDCLDGADLPACFNAVSDLGAIDIARGYDHGMPTYNQLRQAYGLPARTSFTAITGETTDQFPSGLGIDDPASLEYVELRDIAGNQIDLTDGAAAQTRASVGIRATTLAARLRAIFGSVDNVDAFTGMVAERHVSAADMGILQRAIWASEFTKLRDGDRFFYGNDPGLSAILEEYGIDYRHNLGDLIAANTDIPRAELNANVFVIGAAAVAGSETVAGGAMAAACQASFTVVDQWTDGFDAMVSVTNTGDTPVDGWELGFQLPDSQVIRDSRGARFTQAGPDVTVAVERGSGQAELAPGETATGWLRASYDTATDPEPARFQLNGDPCTI